MAAHTEDDSDLNHIQPHFLGGCLIMPQHLEHQRKPFSQWQISSGQGRPVLGAKSGLGRPNCLNLTELDKNTILSQLLALYDCEMCYFENWRL